MQTSLPIQSDFPLKALNTLGIDVRGRSYLAVDSVEDLFSLHHDSVLAAMPRLILGGGSNVFFLKDFPGLVLHMCIKGKSVSQSDPENIRLTVSAGENWHDFVLWTLDNGWGGLENLSFIPGTVGAAPVQNIGAYGAEVKDFIHALSVFDFGSGQLLHFDNDDCRFAYRDSFFRRAASGRYAIVDVTFSLPRKWQPNLSYPEVATFFKSPGKSLPSPQDISRAVTAIRMKKLPDPAFIGNVGSFFKNPQTSLDFYQARKAIHPQMPGFEQPDGNIRIAAGWLIDQCGWRGIRNGNVGVHETQALVLVNHGNGVPDEIVALAKAIREDVRSRFGLWLEAEAVFV